jgi:glycolate oxidase FAD binding subunit
VVKNVSGYDIPKLHVGALGTLGVVVEAHLRLHARPAEERSWVFGFGSAEAALDAALEARDTSIIASRCQILTAGALRALGESEPPDAALTVTIGSVPEAVHAQGARLADIVSRSGSAAIEVPDADAFWRRVADLTWAEDPARHLALRIGVRPSDTVKALRAVEASQPAGATLRATIDVATGVLHAAATPIGGAQAVGLVTRVRAALTPLGASCVIEHAPAEVLPTLDVWGDVGPALEPMRRLKGELDPAGVLNPGRFVGGI